MKLSEYVAACQCLIAEHGDRDLVQSLPYAPPYAIQRTPRMPMAAEMRVKGKRETYEKTASSYDATGVSSGEKVFVL